MTSRGLLLILSSPSGAGKSTLARRMLARYPNMQFSVSATTRAPRPGETDAQDYFFKSQTEFDAMVDAGQMLEHAVVFDHSYGTPRGPVEQALDQGRDVIFDVDWQGGQQINQSDLARHVVSVFVLPPSIAALETRLKSRAQDSVEVVARRMAKARNEISHWKEYDYVLINDDLDRCTAQLAAILDAERLKRWRQPSLEDTVASLDAEFEARS